MSKISHHRRGERQIVVCPACGRRVYAFSSTKGAQELTMPRHYAVFPGGVNAPDGVVCNIKRVVLADQGGRPPGGKGRAA